MAHRIVNTPDELDALTAMLGSLKLPITVEWVQGRDRTRDQNALQFLWATEAAYQLGDRTTTEVRNDWKLHHAVPILREESADFRAIYDRAIKPLPYEMKVRAMDIIPVTSLFKVKQMVRYLDRVQRECAEQGIVLTDPDPDLVAYQARHRQTKTREVA